MTSSPSPRHRAASASALAVGTIAIVAVVLDRPHIALAVLIVLVTAGCLLLLDLRRRHQLSERAQARLGALAKELRGELRVLADESSGHRHALDDVARDLQEPIRLLGEELAASTRGLHEEAATNAETTLALLRRLDHEPITEVQALLQLVPKVPGAPPLPPVGGWALTAASLLQIWHIVESDQPRTIVECGSGSSTLWLAYAARHIEGVRIVALDHNEHYAAATCALLDLHGLSDVADVRHAPLRDVTVGGETLSWYDTDQLADVESIDLLLVDGPPQRTGPRARFPAVPLLRDRLATGAVILADDATRPAEQKAFAQWRAAYGVGAPQQLSRDLVMLRCE